MAYPTTLVTLSLQLAQKNPVSFLAIKILKNTIRVIDDKHAGRD